jgi:iron(III) transport system permease protein
MLDTQRTTIAEGPIGTPNPSATAATDAPPSRVPILRRDWMRSWAPTWRMAATTLVLAALIAIVALPVVRLAQTAFEGGVQGFAIAMGGVPIGAVADTIWVAAAVTAIAVSAGTLLALATERAGLPGRRWLRLAILLPLLMPPFVSAQAFAAAYAPAGILDQAFHLRIDGIYGPIGVVAVLAISSVPLAYLLAAAALATRGERAQELAARASGATPLDVVRTITLPLLRPTLAGAGLLVFLSAVNAFGVPAVLGVPGGFSTMTTRLYSDLAFSSDPAAFARVVSLASSLVIVAAAAIFAADRFASGAAVERTGDVGLAFEPSAGRGGIVSSVAIALLIALAAGLPLIALVLAALDRAVGLPPVPANWTLDNFSGALAGPAIPAIATSVVLAAVAASAVVVLGGLAAAATGGTGSVRRALQAAVALGWVVPGSALAVAVLLAYGASLRDSFAIILLAYLAKFWAVGQRAIRGSLDRLPVDPANAVRASGGGLRSVLRTVFLPGLAPVAAAAWLLVFVLALHELTMSSLLYGPGTATLAVVVLNLQQLGDPGVSSALAVVLTLLVLAATMPLLLAGRAGERLLGLR